MNEHYRHTHRSNPILIERQPGRSSLGHPDEILNDSSMINAEKRATLDSWASDARAPKDGLMLRKLDNGAVIRLKDILQALRKLDDDDDPPPSPAAAALPSRYSTMLGAAA
jgi:hypothetical protein